MKSSKGVSIAISTDFLTSFAKLPKSQQDKVGRFVHKFLEDPTRRGINYEKIRDCADKNLRSVRIDQAYRGIVLHPENGNVYVLLWVDHHDEAYRWARKKRAKIHPETGAIQIFETKIVAEPQTLVKESRKESAGLFSNLRDRQLLRLGLPEELIPLVRRVESDEELEEIEKHLPQEAAEALFMLASGFTYEETLREMDIATTATQPVDTADFESALSRRDTKRRFIVVEDELELQAMLNAPLEKWRVFLHPTQRSLVERDWNGPVRVLGGAGTGKTVVAMHRAKWLAKALRPGRRILFTTFTRNLAADIKENLSKICSTSELAQIDVINLDKWVADFLRQHGYDYTIDFGGRTAPLWEQSLNLAPPGLDLPDSFYRQEWEKVIQPQEVMSLKDYFRAERTGRGVRLNRKARKEIWPVFEEYLALLEEHRLREPEDAMRDARAIIERRRPPLPYDHIIVDEAQDMSAQAFRLLRAMVPDGKNDLFIVGDAHQRIYRHRVVLGRCGINIRGRGKRLRINYRTTEENRSWAVALLKGVTVDDLDGGQDEQKGYHSLMHGVRPTVEHFPSFDEEVQYLTGWLLKLSESGEDALKNTCLVARTHNLLEQYETALAAKGITTYPIRRNRPEDRSAPGVRIATMHRVKGLEFDRVMIAGVNRDIVPLAAAMRDCDSDIAKKEIENRERALLYVAATRAKKEVIITSFGGKSPFLD